MTLPVFQSTITDESGNNLAGATVTVLNSSSGDIISLHSNSDGTSDITNPATADDNGFIRFYAEPQLVTITATDGDTSITWEDVPLIATGEDDGYIQPLGGTSLLVSDFSDISAIPRGVEVYWSASTTGAPTTSEGRGFVLQSGTTQTVKAFTGGSEYAGTFESGVIDGAGWKTTAPTAATPSELNTGTDTEKYATAEALNGSKYNPENRQFISSAQTISTGGSVIVAHGLSISDPTELSTTVYAKCLVSDGGYSVGDVIQLKMNSSTAGTTRINTLLVDATNITLQYSSVSNVFIASTFGVGSLAALTNASWELYISARY